MGMVIEDGNDDGDGEGNVVGDGNGDGDGLPINFLRRVLISSLASIPRVSASSSSCSSSTITSSPPMSSPPTNTIG